MTFNHNLRSLFCLTALSISPLNADAPQQELPTIEGDIFIIPNDLGYAGSGGAGFEKRKIENAAGRTLQPQDILVRVWACDRDNSVTLPGFPSIRPNDVCENWSNHYHPQLEFPGSLPLALLDGKKEGDTITLTMHNKTGDKVRVALRCNQESYRYGSRGHIPGNDFHSVLAKLKTRFATNTPNYFIGDVEKLVDAGVLHIEHGPKGFKLKQQEQQ